MDCRAECDRHRAVGDEQEIDDRSGSRQCGFVQERAGLSREIYVVAERHRRGRGEHYRRPIAGRSAERQSAAAIHQVRRRARIIQRIIGSRDRDIAVGEHVVRGGNRAGVADNNRPARTPIRDPDQRVDGADCQVIAVCANIIDQDVARECVQRG